MRAKTIMDGFWKRMSDMGKEANPYQAGFAQTVCVAETDKEAKEMYAEHIDYFYNRCLHVYPGFADAPGYRTNRTVKAGIKSQLEMAAQRARMDMSWEALVENGYVVAGSPETVTRRLNDLADTLNVGHLMLLLQQGNMPRDKALFNTQMFAERVMPNLRSKFNEFEDKWYPKMMPASERATPIPGEVRMPVGVGGGGAA